MRITQTHVYFWDSCFSQWYASPFMEDDITFQTAEHYMMYHKAKLFGDIEIAAKVLETIHPKNVKALGRQVSNFNKDIWDQHCDNIVIKGNLLKFSQNSLLLAQLQAYSDKIFVEASPVDLIWGVGLHENDDLILDSSNWRGQNKLGNALTTVAHFLKDIKC